MKNTIINDNFIFDGIKTKKAKEKIIKLLNSCKEIRDTAYPLNNSNVTSLQIIDLKASKQKDYTYVTGTLLLTDGDINEKRTFEAYITSKEKEEHVLLDITRVEYQNSPNMIRTTDVITEDENNITSVTSYCGIGYLQEKVFSSELSKNILDEIDINNEQLSVL